MTGSISIESYSNLPWPKDDAWTRQSLELLEVGVVVYRALEEGADFEFVDINPTVEKLEQLNRNELVGQRLTSVFPGVEEFGLLEVLRRVLKTGQREILPACEYRDEHRSAWRENTVYRLDNGLLLVIYRDVTQQHREHAAKEASEERYKLLTESTLDGIFDWNVVSNELYLSPRWKAQLGYSDSELDNSFDTWLERLHDDDRPRILARLEQFLAYPEALWDAEFRLRHKEGHYRWVQARASSVLNADGELVRLLGVHIDIDRRKRAESAAKHDENLLSLVFDVLPDLFFLMEQDGTVIDYRANRESDLYAPPSEFLGRRMHDLLPAPLNAQFEAKIAEAATQPGMLILEYALSLPAGEKQFEARISRLPESTHVVAVVRDISSAKAAMLALNERVKEQHCLYSVQREIQAEHSPELMFARILQHLREAMQYPEHTVAAITFKEQQYLSDTGVQPDWPVLTSPIRIGEKQLGRIDVYYRENKPFILPEEQKLIDGLAETLSIWAVKHEEEQKRRLFERIVSNSDDMMSFVDTDYVYRMVNQTYLDNFQKQLNDIVGQSVETLLGSETFEHVVKPNLDRCFSGESVHYQEEFQLYDKRRYLDVVYSPYRDPQNVVLGAVVSVRDITELRESQEKVNQAAEVFRSTIEGVTITDLEGTILDVNDAFCSITGYSRDEVLGNNPRILQSGRHDEAFYQEMWNSILVTGNWRGEIWNRRKDGLVYPELLTISTVKNDQDDPIGYVAVFNDITATKQAENRLEYLAHHDPLTGLPNRLLFNSRLNQSIRHSEREHKKLAVVFIDLDRFKNVNDSLGHACGDQLLIELSTRLSASVRSDDTVARLSGDEFVVLLENVGDANQVAGVVRKLTDTFNEPFLIGEQHLRMTCSLGVTLFPEDGRTDTDLLRNADAAMYRAKEAGRNTFEFYSQEMTVAAFEHVFIENALRSALEQQQFELFYQPQIDLEQGQFCGVEALIRWHHPEQGVIPPSRFIPVAEKSGLIRDIDTWVLMEATRQASEWDKMGVAYKRVAVNVSGAQIQQRGFASTVGLALAQSHLAAAKLEIEVTEGYVMQRREESIRQLQQLHDMGVSVAIDDFGTGYSSLAYLKQLPVDRLKIDRSFIGDIPKDANDEAITEAIVAMGRALGLTVIAEGVENQQQLNYLRRIGCREAQGYLYSRPVNPTSLVAVLENFPDF